MTAMAQSFEQRYQALTDEELMQLALERQDMVAAACAALDEELARRGLGEGALQNFRNRLLAENATEQLEHGEPLPPPMELPDDWFDEKADPTPPSLSVLRPKGVTVAAWWLWANGTVGIIVGTVWARQDLAAGGLNVALGTTLFFLGLALWRLRPWARRMTTALLWAMAALNGLLIMVAAINTLRGRSGDVQQIFAPLQFWAMLWEAGFALYLGGDTAQKAFRHPQLHEPSGAASPRREDSRGQK